MRRFLHVFTFISMAFLGLHGSAIAQEQSLKTKISALEVLPLAYGANMIPVGNTAQVMIVRGRLKTETAWGGDGYSVLMRDGDTWQYARKEGAGWEGVVTAATPHTGEDNISSIYFLVPRGTASTKKISALYLLKVTREGFKDTSYDSVPAKFSLLALDMAKNDFGTLYFQEVAAMTSKAKYCNSNTAAHDELDIPFSEGEEDFKCLH